LGREVGRLMLVAVAALIVAVGALVVALAK
jgi:hypothetical protein